MKYVKNNIVSEKKLLNIVIIICIVGNNYYIVSQLIFNIFLNLLFNNHLKLLKL